MVFGIIIYLRKEILSNEYRTPLAPKDIVTLIENGFIVYIESSNLRIYSDNEYTKESEKVIITNKKWYDEMFSNALIIGLKEFDNLDKLNNHKHLYFSHSYKNQNNSEIILKHFSKSNSIIYDFEFFLDSNEKRIISFGFYAGIAGGLLGLMQYLTKKKSRKNIKDLIPFHSEYEIIKKIMKNNIKDHNLKIGIIGYNGKCGQGVINVLNQLEIKYNKINKNDNKEEFKDYDIFYNCILLDKKCNDVFFDNNTEFYKNIIIVDISCDYNQQNNPIKIYNENTTWKNPVFNYNNFVDIIAISNLPSLLPKDSSNYFSSKCVQLLRNYCNDENKSWNKCKKIFLDKIKNI